MKEIVLKGIDEVIYHDVTPEGLNIYMWVNEKISNFYATYSINYGSVDTCFKVGKKVIKVPNGTAHFLEHLKFNISEGKTCTEYFNELGLSINAFTTYDFTSYEIFGDTNFEDGLKYLIEYVSIPYFTEELVEKEKGIIVEETSMVFDNPYNKLYHESYRSLFHKNGRRNLIAGYADEVRSTKLEDIVNAYHNFYHPENSFIVVTGNINPVKTASIIKKKLKSIKFSEYTNPVKIYEEEPLEVVEVDKTINCKVELVKSKLVYKLDTKAFKKFSKEKMLVIFSIILRHNFGDVSDLKEDLFNKELITGLYTNYSLVDNHYILGFNIESNYMDDVLEIVKDKMSNLKIDSATIKRRARANIASLINSFDDIEYVNGDIQNALITHGCINDDLYGLYNDITLDDVNYVIKNIKSDNYVVVRMNPLEEKS